MFFSCLARCRIPWYSVHLPHKTTLQHAKVARTCRGFRIFTSKRASRHNGVHFSTSQLPNVLRATTACALFRHLNFQKWSEHGELWTFWLPNLLRASTACTFSTCQCPKVNRTWGTLYILTWKCASRHSGVHFSISHLTRWLRTRHFHETTSWPSGATNHWKNTACRDFSIFSHT